MKISQENPNLFKIGQKYQHFILRLKVLLLQAT
jgi:hypothetical protein